MSASADDPAATEAADDWVRGLSKAISALRRLIKREGSKEQEEDKVPGSKHAIGILNRLRRLLATSVGPEPTTGAPHDPSPGAFLASASLADAPDLEPFMEEKRSDAAAAPLPLPKNVEKSSPTNKVDSDAQISIGGKETKHPEIKVAKNLQPGTSGTKVKKRGTATNEADLQSAQVATSVAAVLPPLHRDVEKTLVTRVMRQSTRAAIFTLKQATHLEEQFLAFLRGYKENGHYFYKGHAWNMRIGSTMYIHYEHLDCFNLHLAYTVRIFFKSVRKNIINAVESFLNDETKFQWRNPLVKICDLPTRHSFVPLKEFWSLPGHNPSEEVVISYGKSTLRVVKTTPSGRITFLNLLLMIFDTHGKGHTWGGKWGIDDVLVNENYEIKVLKPFCRKFKKKYMMRDFVRCAEDVIPKLNCGGQLPAFFEHLSQSLTDLLMDEPHITSIAWKKFFDFSTTHLALAPPLNRSTLYDNVHEMYQSLGKRAQSLLEAILNSQVLPYDWASFLTDGSDDVSTILSSVYAHNKKKVAQINRKNKTAGQGRTRDVGVQADAEQLEGDVDIQIDTEGRKDSIAPQVAQTESAKEGGYSIVLQASQSESEPLPFENSIKGLLVFTRHVKQHGSKGSRDVKGKQHLEKLSEIDLVISAYLEALPEVLYALIYFIDSQFLGFDQAEYDEILKMLHEILQAYNMPEFPNNRELIRIEGEKAVVWANVNSDSEERFRILDDYLLTRSYISRFQFSNYDMAAFLALSCAPPLKYINLTRWYNHISVLQGNSGVHAATPEFIDQAHVFYEDVDLSSEEDEECAPAQILLLRDVLL